MAIDTDDGLADGRGSMRLLGAIIRQAAFDCSRGYKEGANEWPARWFLESMGIVHRVDEIVSMMESSRGRKGGRAVHHQAA